jgi:broad specificity phosphatase PhoE
MAAATTTVLLIRHAHTSAVGQALSGRLPGVTLSAAGLAQAEALARALNRQRLAAIYTSPLERAVLTATAIARAQHVSVRVLRDSQEIDYGEWSGRPFRELEGDPRWRLFNTQRAVATIPGGESLMSAQQRIVGAIERLARVHRGETIAIVTHAEMIRLALLHFARLTLDAYDRLEIAPASVSTLTLSVDGP